MNRRAILKGLGGIAVGLPMLEEMAYSAASTAAKDVPVRAFNVFFGLDIPAPLQKEGYGARAAQAARQVARHAECRSGAMRCQRDQHHFDGATGSFTAMPAGGEAKAGGPSIDQVVRQAHHPDGLPPGMVPTLIGNLFQRSRVGRYLHSYNLDGTVAGTMQEKPRDLFDRVFGVVNAGTDGDAKATSSVACSIPWWINTSFTPGQTHGKCVQDSCGRASRANP